VRDVLTEVGARPAAAALLGRTIVRQSAAGDTARRGDVAQEAGGALVVARAAQADVIHLVAGEAAGAADGVAVRIVFATGLAGVVRGAVETLAAGIVRGQALDAGVRHEIADGAAGIAHAVGVRGAAWRAAAPRGALAASGAAAGRGRALRHAPAAAGAAAGRRPRLIEAAVLGKPAPKGDRQERDAEREQRRRAISRQHAGENRRSRGIAASFVRSRGGCGW